MTILRICEHPEIQKHRSPVVLPAMGLSMNAHRENMNKCITVKNGIRYIGRHPARPPCYFLRPPPLAVSIKNRPDSCSSSGRYCRGI